MSKLQIPVQLPSDQHRIVDLLDTLEHKSKALKRMQAETTAELDAMLASEVDKAFKVDL